MSEENKGDHELQTAYVSACRHYVDSGPDLSDDDGSEKEEEERTRDESKDDKKKRSPSTELAAIHLSLTRIPVQQLRLNIMCFVFLL